MPLLNDQIRNDVKTMLGELPHPVVIKMFTQSFECEYCKDTRELVTEVAELNENIKVEVYDFIADEAVVQEFNIDKIPALAITGAKDYGIRMYGIPSGYEFGSLIEAIKMVSEAEKPALSQPALDLLAKLKDPVHMQVFITPT